METKERADLAAVAAVLSPSPRRVLPAVVLLGIIALLLSGYIFFTARHHSSGERDPAGSGFALLLLLLIWILPALGALRRGRLDEHRVLTADDLAQLPPAIQLQLDSMKEGIPDGVLRLKHLQLIYEQLIKTRS